MVKIQYKNVLPETGFDHSGMARWGYLPMKVKDFGFGTDQVFNLPTDVEYFGADCSVLAKTNEERYEEVVRLLIGEALLNSLAHGFLVGAYAHLGLEDEARESRNLFVRERRLEFASRNIVVEEDTVESLAGSFRTMWRNQASWEQFADGLRKAGLPG